MGADMTERSCQHPSVGHSRVLAVSTLVQSVRLTFMHQRPIGTRMGLITNAAAATTPTMTASRYVSTYSSPMNTRTSGVTASPTAAPSAVNSPASHHCGSTVIEVT